MRRDLKSVRNKGETWKYPELFDEHGNLKPDVVQEAELSEMLFDGDGLLIKGGTPVLYGGRIDGRGMRFNVRLLAQSTDGECTVGDGSLAIRHASEAVLILTSGSSYNGFDKSPSRAGKDESLEAQTALEQAAKKSFAHLRDEHVNDYRSLFDRVNLNLGAPTARSALPTPERIRHYAQGGDEALAVLYYQFGRYLLIAGSRGGWAAVEPARHVESVRRSALGRGVHVEHQPRDELLAGRGFQPKRVSWAAAENDR